MSARFRPASILLLTLAFHAASTLHAQREPTLELGSYIEIVSEKLPGGIGVGWLRSLTKDTLTYVDTIAVTSLALKDIGQLRVNVGRDKASTNVATVAGAMLGILIGTTTKPKDYECLSSLAAETDCGSEVPAELVGALGGAGVLRLLSRFTLEERWVNVNLDRLLQEPGEKPL